MKWLLVRRRGSLIRIAEILGPPYASIPAAKATGYLQRHSCPSLIVQFGDLDLCPQANKLVSEIDSYALCRIKRRSLTRCTLSLECSGVRTKGVTGVRSILTTCVRTPAKNVLTFPFTIRTLYIWLEWNLPGTIERTRQMPRSIRFPSKKRRQLSLMNRR